jgi:hypothetical protein
MSRRGRPRADRIGLVEEIDELLRADPNLSANQVQKIVGARRAAVLRVVRILRPRELRPGSSSAFGQASPENGAEVVPYIGSGEPGPPVIDGATNASVSPRCGGVADA